MTMRPYLVGVSLAIVLVINGRLLYTEEVLDPEKSQRHVAQKEDPLAGLRYNKARREQNLKAYGFKDTMLRDALEKMRDLDDRYGERLTNMLEAVSDPDALADALCGTTNQVRPRYGGFRLFVEASGGQRDPIRLNRVTGLKIQNWYKVSPISQVYQHVELTNDPKPDATLMAVAAILVDREQDLLEDHKPWGRGMFGGSWSWAKVQEEHPGISDRVIRYFALTHLALEQVNTGDGICTEEADQERKPG